MLSVEARAKVNLGLSVLGKRPDGFHSVETLLARITLADHLTLEKRATGITLSVCGGDLGLAPRDNLAHRAPQLYLHARERLTGQRGGVALTLEKRVPVAAGLGGGSADAGAVLRGLAALYPCGLELRALAAELGSDIPFFAADCAAAWGRGRGEVLEPVTLPHLALVVVYPGVGVSAGAAYGALEAFTPPLNPAELLASLARDPSYVNALEPGVVRLERAVSDVLTALRETELKGVLMSGSGSSCFGLARDLPHAREVARSLSAQHPDWWVCATQTDAR